MKLPLRLRVWWQRMLARVLPWPEVELTFHKFSFPFKTKVRYLESDGEIVRITGVEFNLYLPGDLVRDDEVIHVVVPIYGGRDVELFDFILYGFKWEATVQAVVRCVGLIPAMILDDWVMGEESLYRRASGEAFPFFPVPEA